METEHYQRQTNKEAEQIQNDLSELFTMELTEMVYCIGDTLEVDNLMLSDAIAFDMDSFYNHLLLELEEAGCPCHFVPKKQVELRANSEKTPHKARGNLERSKSEARENGKKIGGDVVM